MDYLVACPAQEPFFTFPTKPDDGAFHFVRTKAVNFSAPLQLWGPDSFDKCRCFSNVAVATHTSVD